MNDLVFSQNNKVYASSMKVAEIFQKQHKNVLRDIEEIIEDFPIQEHLHIFGETQTGFKMPTGGIRKDKVLRDIEEIIEDFPIQEHLHNFEPVKYQDAKGEYRPTYQMTRDGFAILVMKDNSMKVEFEVKSA